MADIKWSAFPLVGEATSSTTLVGLQAGANGRFSLSATPAASSVALWDANINLSANSLIGGYATTATSAITTTLTVASKEQQFFTGVTTQTVVLPVTSTLVLGQSFTIVNNSTGVVTVESSGANVIQAMAAKSVLVVTCILTSGTTAASWNAQYTIDAYTSGAITTIDGDAGSVTPSSGVVTISGGATGITTSGSGSTLDLTGVLVLANGGTSASLTASNGGIFYSTASAGAILAGTATANQILLSGSSTTPAWSTATYPATTTVSQILYSSSANVIGEITTANNGVMITSNTGVPSFLANSGTAGFVLTANSGAPASWQAVPTQNLAWAANAGTTVNAAVGSGYVLTAGTTTVVNLPTTFAVGQQIGVQGQGSSWTAALGAATNIKAFGNTYTTSVASANNSDSVIFIGIVANTSWAMLTISSTGLTAS